MAQRRKRSPKAADNGQPQKGARLRMEEIEGSLQELPVFHRLETMVVGDRWGEFDHTTPRNELIHVLRGQARIVLDKRSFNVRPGDTFVIPKGTAHRDVRQGPQPYRVVYVFFDWPAGEKMLRQINPQKLLSAPDAAKVHLRRLMKEKETT